MKQKGTIVPALYIPPVPLIPAVHVLGARETLASRPLHPIVL